MTKRHCSGRPIITKCRPRDDRKKRATPRHATLDESFQFYHIRVHQRADRMLLSATVPLLYDTLLCDLPVIDYNITPRLGNS